MGQLENGLGRAPLSFRPQLGMRPTFWAQCEPESLAPTGSRPRSHAQLESASMTLHFFASPKCASGRPVAARALDPRAGEGAPRAGLGEPERAPAIRDRVSEIGSASRRFALAEAGLEGRHRRDCPGRYPNVRQTLG